VIRCLAVAGVSRWLSVAGVGLSNDRYEVVITSVASKERLEHRLIKVAPLAMDGGRVLNQARVGERPVTNCASAVIYRDGGRGRAASRGDCRGHGRVPEVCSARRRLNSTPTMRLTPTMWLTPNMRQEAI